jgi:hypothetical protein
MERLTSINLRTLEANCAAQIASMTTAIENPLGSELWTARMRPAVRGGKCKVGGFVEDQDTDK